MTGLFVTGEKYVGLSVGEVTNIEVGCCVVTNEVSVGAGLYEGEGVKEDTVTTGDNVEA